ncbi:hypothetical protein [Ideonella sp. A 288]|uniref:hypothetical protein n=1 Tax=Ideonella sp. A 288 TaxID=1962181 RepID=UPI000B4C004E|nr:hypothetical protein [Ideonella sp. A 288]
MTTLVNTSMAAAVMLAAAGAAWWLVEAEPAPQAVAVPAGQTSPTGPQAAVAALPPALVVPPPLASPPAAPKAPAVTLAGLLVGADRQPLAVVSVDGGPEALVRVGDPLGSAASVVRIDEGSMTYRFGDRELRVTVRPREPGPALITSTPPAQTQPGFVAAAPAIARPAGTLPGSGNDTFRQAVDRKLQAIAAGR